MNILLAASFFPYPLLSGGQVRLYNLLRFLGKRHKITLVCEIRKPLNSRDFNEIKKYCEKVITVTRQKQWSLSNIFKTGFSLYPFLLVGHKNQAMKEIIANEIENGNFDLIHTETFYIMHNLPKTELPVILCEHNIEYEIYRNWVENFRFFPLKPLLYLDVLKLKFWERHFWQKADFLIAVSDRDQSKMSAISKKKVALIPNGVDCDYFAEIVKKEPAIPRIVYAGSFKWMQNKDAVKYLLQNIWPKINKKFRKLKLWIVGNYARENLGNQRDKNIIINDKVKDIRRIYTRATILLAPIRIGGGTKFKILESMASGLPVVTTDKGVEGLGPDTNGIIIGKDDDELVEQVVRLLRDKKLRSDIANKELEFVRRHFDWEGICLKLQELYDQAKGTK